MSSTEVNFEGNEEFQHFNMVVASEYVKRRLMQNGVTPEELNEAIRALECMFIGGNPQNYSGFQIIVCACLLRKSDIKKPRTVNYQHLVR